MDNEIVNKEISPAQLSKLLREKNILMEVNQKCIVEYQEKINIEKPTKSFMFVSTTSIDGIKTYQESIGEIAKINLEHGGKMIVGSKLVRHAVLNIMYMYFKNNVKFKTIIQPMYLNMLCDHFVNDCSNLELQEVEFIIRTGVMGLLGTIYSEVTIDTITGEHGWIENYYKKIRPKRSEPTFEQNYCSVNHIPYDEFISSNPEYLKDLSNLREIYEKALDSRLDKEDIVMFYFLKRMTQSEYEEDLNAIKKEYSNLNKKEEELITKKHSILSLLSKYESKQKVEHGEVIRDLNEELKKNEINLNEVKTEMTLSEKQFIDLGFRKFIIKNIYNKLPE